MNNELIVQKNWWSRHWKWVVPSLLIIVIGTIIFISSGMGTTTSNFAQAFSDTKLYANALEKVNANPEVNVLLGEIEPVGKMAILEGQTDYSGDNQTVNTTVRIQGTKGKARMDIVAEKFNGEWKYSKINVRIKNPPENKQTIEIITAE